jgi:hypothetical protein
MMHTKASHASAFRISCCLCRPTPCPRHQQLCKLLKLYEKAQRLPECALSDFERPYFQQEGLRILKALEYPVRQRHPLHRCSSAARAWELPRHLRLPT